MCKDIRTNAEQTQTQNKWAVNIHICIWETWKLNVHPSQPKMFTTFSVKRPRMFTEAASLALLKRRQEIYLTPTNCHLYHAIFPYESEWQSFISPQASSTLPMIKRPYSPAVNIAAAGSNL
jgi:hypothetical protein